MENDRPIRYSTLQLVKSTTNLTASLREFAPYLANLCHNMDLIYCESSCLEIFTGIYRVPRHRSQLFSIFIIDKQSSQLWIWRIHYENLSPILEACTASLSWLVATHDWPTSIFKKKKKIARGNEKKSQPLKDDEICDTR